MRKRAYGRSGDAGLIGREHRGRSEGLGEDDDIYWQQRGGTTSTVLPGGIVGPRAKRVGKHSIRRRRGECARELGAKMAREDAGAGLGSVLQTSAPRAEKRNG